MSRIKSGMFWVALSRYSSRVLGLVSTFILAGLLTRGEFGLMGGALIVIGIFDLFYDFGISKELIYRRDRLDEASDTAFVMNVAFGAALFGLVLLGAPFAATALDLPGVTGVLMVAGASLLTSSVGKVPAALLQKQQRFKALAVPLLFATIASTSTAITAAVLGAGAYSLALREVVGSIVEVVGLLALAGYRPRLRFDMGLCREILGYAKHLLGANLLAAVQRQVVPTVLARGFGSEVLGAYAFASRGATLPTREAAVIFNRVLFPSFSERRNDPNALRELLLKATRAMALFGVAASLAIVWVAPPMLHFFYGDKWDAAVPFFQALPWFALLMALVGPAGEACKAIGQTRVQLEYYAMGLVLILASAWPAAHYFGPIGPIGAAIGAALVGYLWMTWRAACSIGLAFGVYLGALRNVTLGTIPAVAAGFTLQAVVPATMPVAQGLVAAAAVLTIYAVVVIGILDREFLLSVSGLRRRKRSETLSTPRGRRRRAARRPENRHGPDGRPDRLSGAR